MRKFLGPRIKKIRRLLDLPGFSKKKLVPKKLEDRPLVSRRMFGKLLKEKQKLRFNYGIREKQLKPLIKKTKKQEAQERGAFLKLLEMRLDRLVFSLRFRETIPEARHFINSKKISVNGIMINSPGFPCNKGDFICSDMEKKFHFINRRNLVFC